MELDTKIKWTFLIFSILQCMTSGCEYLQNGCYMDVYCSAVSTDLQDFGNLEHNRNCNNNINNINGYEVSPVRFKIESKYAVSSILNNAYVIDNKQLIMSLDITNTNLEIFPEFAEMANLKLLNLSNNNLGVAKLFNEVELISLESIDLSHNYISSIDVDNYQFVYQSVKNLNISNNLLTNIPGGVFEPFKDLEYLDLSHNYIAGINHYTFDGLRNLKYLYLSYNNISDINVSLFRFSNLEELYLSNNDIEILSIQNFEPLRNLRTLSLEFNKIKSIEKDIFINTVSLTTLKLHHNLINNIYKDVFLSTNNLKLIDLSNNLIENLPKDLFRNKNITSFSITGNNLKGAISKGIFEGLQLITELDISYQALTVIEDFAFLGFNKLIMLLLNNNEIRTITERSFNTLVCLKTLDLSYNQIISIGFNKADFISLDIFNLGNNFIKQIQHEDLQGLNRLRVLDVSNNNITKLDFTAFRNLETIEILELFKNPIGGALLSNSFNGLHLIPVLDLSHTSITSIQNESFSGMVQLQELNISRSSINKVEYDAFMYTGNIKTIDLSFNKITDFHVNGNDLKNLTSLYLNNNVILQISNFGFKHMIGLNKIIVSYNLIQTIDDNCFADQTDLRFLDISFNNHLNFNTSVINNIGTLEMLLLSGINSTANFKSISNVPIRNLELSYLGIRNISLLHINSMRHLTNLIMSNNNITNIEFGAFKNISSLKWLDLSFNNIYFIQQGTFKDNVFIRHLNLSHNSLTSLNFGIFRGLIGLNLLDVSYNSIHDIQTERFYDTPNLKTLIVDHNRIKDVRSDFFNGRMNLDLLSIGHNPLSCENIIELKRYGNFKVSAVNTDESNADNIDGIVCNINKYNEKPQIPIHVNSSMSEKLLVNIRDILLNSSESRGSKLNTDIDNTDLLKDSINQLNKHASDHTLELKDIKTEVVYGLNGTYSLLERILKVMLNFGIIQNKFTADNNNNRTTKNDNFTHFAPNTTLVGNHLKLDALVSDVNQMRQELLYMETVISGIDRKLSLGRTLNAPSIEKINKSDHEGIAYKNNERSFIFLEICVSIILLMLVCFFMYKFYETKILKHSRSLSTRHITDSMDNSNL